MIFSLKNKRTNTAIAAGILVWPLVFFAAAFFDRFKANPESHWMDYALAETSTVLAGSLFGVLVLLSLGRYRSKRADRAGLEEVKSAKNSLEEAQKELMQAQKDEKNAKDEERDAQDALEKAPGRLRPEASAEGGSPGSADDATRGKADRTAAVDAAEQAKTRAKAAHDTVAEKTKKVAEAEAKLGKIPDRKILQPQYAIGQGLITRDDFDTLRNEYLAQSDLSVGLIVPVAFLLFALAVTPQLGDWRSPWLIVGLGVATAALTILAVDRRHKYTVELQSLILGSWVKKTEAAKAAEKAAKDAAEKAAKDTAAQKASKAASEKAAKPGEADATPKAPP
jgi:type II secretory pathway pseudopilin PulG